MITATFSRLMLETTNKENMSLKEISTVFYANRVKVKSKNYGQTVMYTEHKAEPK